MYKKILVVVDDREATQSAICQAIEIAQVHHAAIHKKRSHEGLQ